MTVSNSLKKMEEEVGDGGGEGRKEGGTDGRTDGKERKLAETD